MPASDTPAPAAGSTSIATRPPAGATPGARRPFGIVFLILFLDLLGFGLIIPIAPYYAEQFGASPAEVTWLSASYSLMQFLFASFWGRLSDRYGRRPIVLISIAVSVGGWLIYGFAATLAWLFAARILAGFGNANVGVAQAIIADVTTPENRAKGMGILGAAFGLGFIVGPALGGFLGYRYGYAVPAFVAAGLAAANWILALLRLPETRPAAIVKAPRTHRRLSLSRLRGAFRHPGVAPLLALFLVVTLAFAMMEVVLGLFIEHTWVPPGATARREAVLLLTWLMLSIGVISAVVQGGLIGRLTRRYGERVLARAGVAQLAVGLAIVPLIGVYLTYPWMFIAGALLAVGSGLTMPSLSSLLSRAVSAGEQGATLGLGQSLSSLGRVIGPGIAGVLFERGLGLPFWVGAALMVGCLLVTLRLAPPPSAESAATEALTT